MSNKDLALGPGISVFIIGLKGSSGKTGLYGTVRLYNLRNPFIINNENGL